MAIVSGAGSGVGRAVTLKLLVEGWAVALVGRRPDALAETVRLAATASRRRVLQIPCDISQVNTVENMVSAVLARFGRIDALVNAAGVNTPSRGWSEVPLSEYHRLMAANLHGAFHSVRAVLPVMRRNRKGTIVFINSDAGLRASVNAGVAYVASKFALRGIAQAINAEERRNGLRACSLFPGEIDTEMLKQRLIAPTSEARARMLQPEDVAACVWLAVSLPSRAVVEELLVKPL